MYGHRPNSIKDHVHGLARHSHLILLQKNFTSNIGRTEEKESLFQFDSIS
jgi:hypothetical protein